MLPIGIVVFIIVIPFSVRAQLLWLRSDYLQIITPGGGQYMGRVFRPDRDGTHQAEFNRNKKIIYATQTVCGICGKPVDPSYKYPHPLSRCIDHIMPVAKGGHPSDMDNLQLAHWTCNRQKSDKILRDRGAVRVETGKAMT
jgi:5-methylcytosine-specific restriction endonuclease McrA